MIWGRSPDTVFDGQPVRARPGLHRHGADPVRPRANGRDRKPHRNERAFYLGDQAADRVQENETSLGRATPGSAELPGPLGSTLVAFETVWHQPGGRPDPRRFPWLAPDRRPTGQLEFRPRLRAGSPDARLCRRQFSGGWAVAWESSDRAGSGRAGGAPDRDLGRPSAFGPRVRVSAASGRRNARTRARLRPGDRRHPREADYLRTFTRADLSTSTSGPRTPIWTAWWAASSSPVQGLREGRLLPTPS
jgi:hypothetical protein